MSIQAIKAPSIDLATAGLELKKPASSVESAGTDTDFTTMISEAVNGLAKQLRQAEAVSVAGIKGMASTQDVVQQVMAAEQALQASIAVRDKIVAAYLEISRMSI